MEELSASCSRLVSKVLRPGNFYAGKNLQLEFVHRSQETLTWEIYRGRLLDPRQTRQQRTFESWSVYRIEDRARSAEPLLSLKLDRTSRQLHVTRALYSYVWEGYDAGNNTFLSRETCDWVQELVASIALDRFADVAELEDELVCALFHAVVGSSRLPLTSLEAPLPDFSLGRLCYCHQPDPAGTPAGERPLQDWQQLLNRGLPSTLAPIEQAKLLEILLRSIAAAEVGGAAAHFAERCRALGRGSRQILALCRTLFNEVALSPYTDFVPKFLLFLKELEAAGYLSAADRADFLSYLLRQLGRHLTAYDLVIYHHQGANYPDALLLDEVLEAFLAMIETQPQLFTGTAANDPDGNRRQRLRRRGLRQGCLQRLLYEGLRVPDEPTSPGENSRVLPPPHVRVPEEQILTPAKRRRRLFSQPLQAMSHPQVQAVWAQALADLQTADELRELGLALFLDRPLGRLKAAGEPDRTPLLSYEAFSPALIGTRLQFLRERLPHLFELHHYQACQKTLAVLPGEGLAVREPGPVRPGSVSLSDALRVAADFRLLRTTRRAAREFFELFNFSILESFGLTRPTPEDFFLIVDAAAAGRGSPGNLLFFRAGLTPWLEVAADWSQGYQARAGREFPAAGLRVIRIEDGAICQPTIPPSG